MESSRIYNQLIRNREDLELIRANPTGLPEEILASIIRSVEVHAPYKAIQLFKLLNAVQGDSLFPEDSVDLNEIIEIFHEQGDVVDASIQMAMEDKELVFFPYQGLDAKKVVGILIHQMLSNAEEATLELRIEDVIKSRFS